MHTWPSAARLRYLSRRGRLAARLLNAHMLRPPWMAQLRVARGWSSHSSGPCEKVGFFILSRWNRAARWSVPMVTVDELQCVGVHSRDCFDSVYDSHSIEDRLANLPTCDYFSQTSIFDLSDMGGPAGSLRSRQHSSRGHRGTQAPPPRQGSRRLRWHRRLR